MRFRFMSPIGQLVAFAALLALTAGIGVASGAIPSGDGTISACQAKVGGVRYLRPIDTQAGEACKGPERLLIWNQKGPKGDRGPQGPKGEPGGSGLGAVNARSAATSVAPGAQGQVDALCLPGERAVGGGFLVDSPKVGVIGDSPSLDLSRWVVEVVNETAETQVVIAQAVCAS